MFYGGSRSRGARWKDEGGSPLPWRPFVDAVGSGIAATDDAANGKTVLTVSGGGATTYNITGGSVIAGVFNVRDYGAVGNNSTDDTAAFQAAQNAAVSYGSGPLGTGVVLVPPGRYAIYGAPDWDGPTNASAPSVVWKGYGMWNSIIRAVNGSLLDVKGNNSSNYGFAAFEDLGFFGPSASGSSVAVFLHGDETKPSGQSGMYGVQFRRCYFNGWGTAIKMQGGLIDYVDKCIIEGAKIGVDMAPTPTGSGGGGGMCANANVVRDSRIVSCSQYGIRLTGGSGFVGQGLDIEACGVGASFGTAGGSLPQWTPNVIRDSWFEGNSTGVEVTDTLSPITLLAGCGFYGSPIKPLSGAVSPVIVEHCFQPTIVNPSGSQPVRTRNCQDVHLTNSGSGYVASDNFTLFG